MFSAYYNHMFVQYREAKLHVVLGETVRHLLLLKSYPGSRIMRIGNHAICPSRWQRWMFKALAVRASDLQSVLARTSFHSPKSLRSPTTAHLRSPTTSFQGFFVLFSSTTLETDRKYISTCWMR